MTLKLLKFFSLLIFIGFIFQSCQKKQKNTQLQSSLGNLEPLEDFSQFPLKNKLFETENFEGVEKQILRMMRELEITGTSVAIVKDGRLVYAKGFGYADSITLKKVEPYHIFRVASVSKLITAVGIMKLVEEGKLQLNSPVFGKNGILNDKEFLKIAEPSMEKIQVQHLLHHTAGWRNRFRADPLFRPLEIAEFMEVAPPPKIETLIQFMLGEHMIAEPGEFYDYSNFGYCVLGKIIEKVSGQDYEIFMQEEILRPIGISRMYLGKNFQEERFLEEVKYYDSSPAKKRLSIYGTGDSVGRVYEGTDIETLGAAGGWVASPIDLLRLVNAIDGFDSKADFLKLESIQAMTSPKDSLENMVMGWKEVNEERWLRTGSLAGTGAVVFCGRDGISWAVVTNRSSWRGPKFSYDIMAAMGRAINSIEDWQEGKDYFKDLEGAGY